jgi:N-acetylneuraminate synthase
MNLRTIPALASRFDLPVGLSDHTTGISAPVAAVTLGACIIEKHITLSRTQEGPDTAFSLEPQEFKVMVEAVRTAERALGEVHFGAGTHESGSRILRRSLFVVEDIKQGDRFNNDNVRSIRPAHGLHTRYFQQILGKRAARHIVSGTPLSWDLIDDK